MQNALTVKAKCLDQYRSSGSCATAFLSMRISFVTVSRIGKKMIGAVLKELWGVILGLGVSPCADHSDRQPVRLVRQNPSCTEVRTILAFRTNFARRCHRRFRTTLAGFRVRGSRNAPHRNRMA
jgi:hypothetical protein